MKTELYKSEKILNEYTKYTKHTKILKKCLLRKTDSISELAPNNQLC